VFDPEAGALYGISETAQHLLRIDPVTGAGTAILSIPVPLAGLTWDGNRKRLLAAGENLYALYPDREEIITLTTLQTPDITGLAYDPETDSLFGLRGTEGLLVRIDTTTGTVHEVGPLIPAGQAFEEVEYGVEAGELPAFGLSFNPAASVLYASADRLMILDPETGVAEMDLWLTRHYFNPTSEAFERFASPMREILDDKEVTYLYTIIMGGRKDILYIVDATPGEDWSPIGYEEELPPQNVEGLVRATEEGVPFISDVMYFDLWGLLKVAAAPIYDEERRIRALAGVDINIDLIRTKTRVALFQVLGFGAVSLVLAGMVSLWVTRRLIRPINQLKYGALRIAAGHYEHPLDIREPRELRELARTLNGIGTTLRETIHGMAETSERMEMGRCRMELAKAIPTLIPAADFPDEARCASRWMGDRAHCADSSGGIASERFALYWIGHRTGEPLSLIKRRADIALALAGCLQRAEDATLLMQQVQNLFRDDVVVWILFDKQSGMLSMHARSPLAYGRITAQAPPERIECPAGTQFIRLEPGSSLVIVSSDIDGRWTDDLAEERWPAQTTSHAGHLADRTTARLQGQATGTLSTRTGMVIVITGNHTP